MALIGCYTVLAQIAWMMAVHQLDGSAAANQPAVMCDPILHSLRSAVTHHAPLYQRLRSSPKLVPPSRAGDPRMFWGRGRFARHFSDGNGSNAFATGGNHHAELFAEDELHARRPRRVLSRRSAADGVPRAAHSQNGHALRGASVLRVVWPVGKCDQRAWRASGSNLPSPFAWPV